MLIFDHANISSIFSEKKFDKEFALYNIVYTLSISLKSITFAIVYNAHLFYDSFCSKKTNATININKIKRKQLLLKALHVHP